MAYSDHIAGYVICLSTLPLRRDYHIGACSMCRPNTLFLLEGRAPQLPPEIIWTIIEELLTDLSITACRERKAVTLPIPLNILTLNRHLHRLVVRAVYHTIILCSLSLLHRFQKVVEDSPHLAYFVHNLWIGTTRLRSFLDLTYANRFRSAIAIGHILSKLPTIKRLALPSNLCPPEFEKLGGGIEHITIGGGAIPELPCEVKTVHVLGSIRPSRVQYLKQRALRRIVFDLERPCRPGAIGHIIQELLGNKAINSQLRLQLVIASGISSWVEDELSQVSVDSSLDGVLAVRVRHPGDKGADLRNYAYCEEWAEATRKS